MRYPIPNLEGFLLLAMLLASNSSAAQAGTRPAAPPRVGTLELQLRDVQTGYGVAGAVCLAPMQLPPEAAQFETYRTNQYGKLIVQLPVGDYLEEDIAPGYQPMKTHTGVGADTVARGQSMLDPTHMPEELQDDSRHRPNTVLVRGYAVDSDRYQPVAGVHMRLEKSGVSGLSNKRGYYELLLSPSPTRGNVRPETPTDTDTLIVEATGYTTIILRDLEIGGGATVPIELSRGRGSYETETPHGHGTPADGGAWTGPSLNPDLLRWLASKNVSCVSVAP